MHKIILEKPYTFVPPVHGRLWPRLLHPFLAGYLRRAHGVTAVAIRGAEHLAESLHSGHGIMLTPNHARPCDPMILGHLAAAVNTGLYIVASRHLFEKSRLQTFLLRRAGAFSIYREGMDREALKCAITILDEARRPLVLFPEGVISRTNDRLNHLMEGTAFIARNAAKQRAARDPQARVVIHPVALRYRFEGDIEAALPPVLATIEQRLSWRPQHDLPLLERIYKIGNALLTLKELEYFDSPRTGALHARLTALIDHLLLPLEQEWLKSKREGDVVSRVKNLRTAILPDMIAGDVSEAERARRWRQLADVYLAQQLNFYPPDYFQPAPTPEKLMETVERFEEDLTDQVTQHQPIHAIIEVGPAIAVNPTRERGVATDPVMQQIRNQLESMLQRLGRQPTMPAAAPSAAPHASARKEQLPVVSVQ